MAGENVLEIFIELVTAQAQQADQQYHQGMRARIKQTQEAQATSERTRLQSIQRTNGEAIKSFNALLRSESRMRADAFKRTASDRASWAKKAAADEVAITTQAIQKVKQIRINAASEEAKIARISSQARARAESADAAMMKQSRNELMRFLKSKSSEHIASEQATEKLRVAVNEDANREIFQDDKDTRRQQVRVHNQALKEMAAAREASDAAHKAHVAKMLAGSEKIRTAMGMEAASTEKTTEKIKEQETSVGRIAKAYTQLRIGAEVGQMIHAVWDAMAQSAAGARDHIHAIVEDMERARTATRELANLEGKKATALYTANIAGEAASVGANVEDYAAGKKSFQEYGAQYVGKENASEEERAEEVKDKKISYEKAQEVQKGAALIMGSMGIPQAEGNKLLGTVVGKMAKDNPNASPEDILLQFRRLAEAARTATGATGVGIGQLQEGIQESVGEGGDLKSMEDSAVIMRSMQEVNPQEGAMLSRSLLRGLAEIRQNKKGQMDDLGITKDMDTFQQLEQAQKAIADMAAETGESETDVVRKYFPDVREFRAARAAFSQGMKGGGFERTRKAMNAITKESIAKEGEQHLKSEEGTKNTQQSNIARAERERASRYTNLERERRDAELALAGTGELEEPEDLANAGMTKGLQEKGYGDRKAQAARTLMAKNLTDRALQTESGRKWLRDHGVQMKKVGGEVKVVGGIGKLTGATANEKELADLANHLDRDRKRNEKNLPAREPEAERNAGVNQFGGNAGRTSAEMMTSDRRNRGPMRAHGEGLDHPAQMGGGQAALNINKAAKNLAEVLRPQVPAPLPARPPVQRN